VLEQGKVETLLVLSKKMADTKTIDFPGPGGFLVSDALDLDEKEHFKIDANRKGRVKPDTKCTYMMRYELTEILIRVDLDGPPHDNPDGETIPCPHVHIYKSGYADKWAYPLPAQEFPAIKDLVATFKDFLCYCKFAEPLPEVQRLFG
jgi:hypothetical protein